MATYKAEFLAHYYKGRIRPLHAYAFGYINKWAMLASFAPAVANFFSQTAGFRDAMKWVLGVAPEREIPAFAKGTFKAWFAEREIRKGSGAPVILWADTFNNYFQPQVAKCAVLEDAGCRVQVPEKNLCCGRPFYDFGLLKPAKAYLEAILSALASEIEQGLPVVMLEPSCCSVFRDELINLLPHNENARRLRNQTFTLAEFLTRKIPGYRVPLLGGRALLHGHCHQTAVMKMTADLELLKRMEVDFEHLDSGCCGLAGAFGYIKGDHYKVSVKCGERVLLPRVRGLPQDQYLVTDGFSCREQVKQQTGKRALHLAEVIHLALKTGRREEPSPQPHEPTEVLFGDDLHSVHRGTNGQSRFRWAAPVSAAAAVVAGAVAWSWSKRNKSRQK